MSPFPSPLDPFAWYAAMRVASPVAHLGGRWQAFGYDAVNRALTDHAAFSSERDWDTGGSLDKSLINLDPPRHRQLRALVAQAFTPLTIARLEPRIVAITRELLDAVVPTGRMDVIDDLAIPLPVIIIAELLGIPATDRVRFKQWSDAIVLGTHGADAATGSALGANWHEEMTEYFLKTIALRQQNPREDLISALLAAQIGGEHLTKPELMGFCVLLLIAGNETTTNLIGNAILCFDAYPETFVRLRQSPALLPGAIEEILRYRSPVQLTIRTTTQPVELGGQMIPPQTPVFIWLGSANHDPAHFPEPERFDIERTPNHHLAFGDGIHFCLGAPLARLEARIALGAMLDRLDAIHLDRTIPLEPLSNFVYGVKHLPITFTAPGSSV